MMRTDLRAGMRIGLWTLVAARPGYGGAGAGRTKAGWLCRCECGYETVVPSTPLRKGTSLGCRPCRTPGRAPTKFQVGDQVGEWTLLQYEPSTTKTVRRLARWKCQCACGVLRWVLANNLTNGQTRSCGHADPRQAARHKDKNARPLNSVFALGAPHG